jgi:hypothetical protein
MATPQFTVPWTSFATPSDLEEWIAGSDERRETAWNEHAENAPNKWLIAAVDSDECSFQPLDSLAEHCFAEGGTDPNEAVGEWVLSCFEGYTGMHGEIYNDIYCDLDEHGRIEAVSGFAVTADNGTVWLAQFEWGSLDQWLIFEYDEIDSRIILADG